MREEQILDNLAGLRLAGALVSELAEPPEGAAAADDAKPIAALPHILIRTSREITSVLNSLYRSRTLLEHAAVPRLQRTHMKLQEVSQATEVATHDMLDKLDRATVLIDEIGGRLLQGVAPADDAALQLHAELREEAHRLVLCLQFQDVVAQQIGFATRVLQETEQRMIRLANQFNSTVFGAAEPDLAADFDGATHFDPDASAAPPAERQALADSVFAGKQA